MGKTTPNYARETLSEEWESKILIYFRQVMKRLVGLVLVFCVCIFGVSPATRSVFTPYEDARPILTALAEIIPAELREARADAGESVWNAWVGKRDAEIRARLAQGDADSVVNFLMFGTSFTDAPRLT